MTVYITITIILLLLCGVIYRAEQAGCTGAPTDRSRGGAAVRLAFVMIFLVMVIPEALRVNTGNDYMKYVEFMHLANVEGAYLVTEPGFNILVRVVYGLCGYENYLLVFALFAAGTAAMALLGLRLQAQDFSFSFFLFLMFGYYLQSYNTVRYYLAMSIIMVALYFFARREWAGFAAMVLLAACFHKSALVVFALWPLCLLPWNLPMTAAAAALGIAVNLPMLRGLWMDVLTKLYPSYANTDFLGQVRFSYVNIARCGVVLLLALYDLHARGIRKKDLPDTERFYFNASLLALGIYVFGSFVPEVSRIAYYLSVTQLFYLPVLLLRSPGKIRRLAVFAAVLYFAAFLYKAGTPTIRILPYRSIVFHDLPKILSEVTQ